MNTWWINCISAVLTLACLVACRPARVRAYTLDQAVSAMQSQHPLLAAARASLSAAEGDAIDVGLWSNPVLSGGWTRGLKDNSYANVGYITWSLGQFLELSNAPGARRRAAEFEVAASRADYDSALASLVFDLEDAVVELAADVETVRVLQALAAQVHEAQRIIGDRVAAGAAPQYDAVRFAITVATLEADLASALANQAQDEGLLKAAIGPGARGLQGELQFDLYSAPELPPLAGLQHRLRAARPDLRALRQRAQSANASVSASSREVFPGLLLQVNGGYGAAPGQVDLGASVTVPLPIVDSGQGSVRASRARAVAASSNQVAIQTPAELALAGAHAAAVQRRAALETFRTVMASMSDKMLEEARAGYVGAKFSVLELVDAYLSLRDARLRAIDLASAARSADTSLGRLVGGSLRLQPSASRGAP